MSFGKAYHNHLDVKEPEGLLIKLFQNLMCFISAHFAAYYSVVD
jgi:hypothetical protein